MKLGVIALIGMGGHASSAHAGPVDDQTKDLSTVLDEFARSADVEIIFDPSSMTGVTTTLHEEATPQATLRRMLNKTGFTFSQAGSRTFVIIRRERSKARHPVPTEDSAAPEIVVAGRRSQNVDIVRGVDEIQPYVIASADDIVSSSATTLDDYLRYQLPLNRDTTPLSQTGASPRSQINLRGVGADQTLVLVDGRRIANIPLDPGLLGQSDLNGIPVEAVDRIEVLATSAGGIFGIGATGGVVNVVLKRDYQGALISAENRVTDRGDGMEHRVYGRLGWQTPGGRTSLMVSGSYSQDAGLLTGDRSYQAEARARRLRLVGYVDLYNSNSINIRSADGSPLTLSAAYGGASLGASNTYLPLGDTPLTAADIAVLLANAGKYDLSLASDAEGTQSSLISRSKRLSLISSFRQEIGNRSELFVDYVRLDDRGYLASSDYEDGYNLVNTTYATILGPGQAGNPFRQSIQVTYPTNIAAHMEPERDLEQRVSAGVIRHFGRGWTAEIDGVYSVASVAVVGYYEQPRAYAVIFSGADALNQSISTLSTGEDTGNSSSRILDANARLNGPLVELPGGAASINLSSEFRVERNDGYTYFNAYKTVTPDSSTDVFTFRSTSPQSTQKVWSAYGEAHLPLIAENGPASPWRGLTGQIAARVDRYTIHIPKYYSDVEVRNKAWVPALTIGVQSHPIAGLMIRGSYSTAATPPTLSQLLSSTTYNNYLGGYDPKRGGPSGPNLFIPVLDRTGADLKAQRTQTFSVGLVVTPSNVHGLRASIDYTRLSLNHQVETFQDGDTQYFLNNEDLYPGRVVRAPLTDADKALGYTGGAITELNLGPLQTGRFRSDSLDAAASYEFRILDGSLHLQASGNWELTDRQRRAPTEKTFDLVGYADGPIPWRVNFGMGWSSSKVSIDGQAQLYAPYSLADGTPLSSFDAGQLSFTAAETAAQQASEPHVSTQAYFDLAITFRPQGRGGMQLRLMIANIFNRMPPIVASLVPFTGGFLVDATPGNGTGSYGDLLGRRFSVNARIPLRF